MRKAQSGYLLLGLDSRLACGTLIRVRGELLGKTLDSVRGRDFFRHSCALRSDTPKPDCPTSPARLGRCDRCALHCPRTPTDTAGLDTLLPDRWVQAHPDTG